MSSCKKALANVLALIFLFTLFTPVLAVEGEVQAIRNTNILKTADSKGEVIGTLSAKSTVERLGVSGDYTLIRYDGKIGYVLSSDIATFFTVNNDGTVSGASSSESSESSQSSSHDDVSVSALRQYSAKAGVNVRSGPGTKYSKIGTLKKGALIYGATKPVGSWINVIYNGKSGYVSASYLAATGVSYPEDNDSDPNKEKGVVYASRITGVYSGAGSGTFLGYLLMGVRCQRLDVKGSYSRIICAGNAGYVPTSDLINVDGTGAYAFSKLNKWRYAAKKDVSAYYLPIANSAYRIGSFSKNEAVWALSGNAYWTKIYVNGRTGYVQASDLLSSPSSGKAIKSTGPYAPGKALTIATASAVTYASSELSDYYIPLYESNPYGMISKGTRVVVMSSTDKYALVIWDDDRDYAVKTNMSFATNLHTAYVRISSIG